MTTNEQSDGPAGDPQHNEYISRTGQSQIPVQKDGASIDDPIDPATADTDEQLARDEQEALDKDNVISSRTRGATKKAGAYTEPGDEEGLPGPDDGTSTVR